MGRKQFRQDLTNASKRPPQCISNIETTDDGEISFRYSYDVSGRRRTVDLQLLALNVDDYPTENEYMIFVRDGDVDPRIVGAFDPLCPIIRNRTIEDALSEISNGLGQVATNGQASNPIEVTDCSDTEVGGEHMDQDEEADSGADDWPDADDDEDFGFDEPLRARPALVGRSSVSLAATENMAKIKSDLRQVKLAGFKVGVYGDLTTSGLICVSIRVSKLGISEEVMKAWGLEPRQYFVLLLRCLNGYRNIESIKEETNLSGSTEVRVGLCSSYKPSVKSAYDAFNEASLNSNNPSQQQTIVNPNDLQPLFISRPLNELFRGRFTRILKFREVYCLSWSGAEQLVHDTQGAITDPNNMDRYDRMYDDTARALPSIVLADALSEKRLKHCSLPLVAMQFALRHFVRCTEFCLVCHCNSGSTFEALKPYVCSSPLCLYQYMGLGFGPSIEWEILSQPYVVDLLISFCYAQAHAGRLRDFPVGIDLRVPVLPMYTTGMRTYPIYGAQPAVSNNAATEVSFKVSYNGQMKEILFPNAQSARQHGLKMGDFIVLGEGSKLSAAIQGFVYHRIEEVMLPRVRLGQAVRVDCPSREGQALPPKALPDNFVDVDCYLFDHNFDELTDDSKAKSIMALLDTLPSVKEMQMYLKTHSVGQDSLLRHWRDRISPPALNILRWIIASNRSCIMQVDTILSSDAAKITESFEDRVSGMEEYMQFRFAQGAPDKEQRFVDCVEQHSANKKYPTIFAWHGSPLSNWHSIIREGLHFKDTMHGRAYGNGVYMSPHAQTSIGYTNIHHSTRGWPNSELKITSAMSLNEVVNDPSSFVSRNPHLVVAQTDWIQTRYLLVKTTAAHTKGQKADMVAIPQDPALTAMNANGSQVQVPITAVSKSRRPVMQATTKVSKKRKSVGSGRVDEPIELVDSDDESVVTLSEDREYLVDNESHSGQTPVLLDSDTDMGLSDDRLEGLLRSPKKKMRQDEGGAALRMISGVLIDTSKTNFSPGELDMTDIQILPPPSDASRTASNSLLKAFNTLLKTQASTPAHELGWYVNPAQVENMYQWIVELHSFDQDLPLAQDMKAAGLTSVVLEMRFTNSWPFAPPFVRVIKPRFLPFLQGGGGHVTDGGAICMELLTNNGWSAVSSIESVLLQVKLAMSERERPARLASQGRHSHGRHGVYAVGEAITAYERACRAHGWTIPESFLTFSRGV